MNYITRYVKPGEIVEKELPFSEVCMHMRVAGRRMKVEVLLRSGEVTRPPIAQILKADGTHFSAPITMGEAGFHQSELGYWYYQEKDYERRLFELSNRGKHEMKDRIILANGATPLVWEWMQREHEGGTLPWGIVLAYSTTSFEPFVTWEFVKYGDGKLYCNTGHYHTDPEEAGREYKARVAEHLEVREER